MQNIHIILLFADYQHIRNIYWYNFGVIWVAPIEQNGHQIKTHLINIAWMDFHKYVTSCYLYLYHLSKQWHFCGGSNGQNIDVWQWLCFFVYVCILLLDFNSYLAKLYYLNFHPLEVVSRYRDPQLQVAENYSYFWLPVIKLIKINYCRD